MKRTSKIFALVFVLSLILTACGGDAAGGDSADKASKGLSADSPVDFTMTVAEFEEIDNSGKAKYEGKTVEITGKVVKTKKSHPNDAADGEWSIHLEGVKPGGFPPTTTCFFATDQAAHMGKEASVKGKVKFYSIAEGGYLTGCFLKAK